MFKIGPMRDFYSGPVVKNLPSKIEDACLIPGQGTKIPHIAGQLSLQPQVEKPMCLSQSKPHTARKSPHTSVTKTQHSYTKQGKW